MRLNNIGYRDETGKSRILDPTDTKHRGWGTTTQNASIQKEIIAKK